MILHISFSLLLPTLLWEDFSYITFYCAKLQTPDFYIMQIFFLLSNCRFISWMKGYVLPLWFRSEIYPQNLLYSEMGLCEGYQTMGVTFTHVLTH